MRSLWCALLVLLVAGQCANACDKGPGSKDPNYPDDPNELVRTRWDAVIFVLQNNDIDPNVKAERINKIVSPMFDFPLMAKLALGRKHWPKLTVPQRKKFTQLFTERLRSSYREKVTLYTDEKASFKPAVQKKKKTTIYIPMELISKGKKIAIVYKLRKVDERRKVKADEGWKIKVDKRWKVYDVEIQGVSILLTYRSQFDDILRKGTVEDILSRLEKPPARQCK